MELWLCQHQVCLPPGEESQCTKRLLAVFYCQRSHVVQCKQSSALCMLPAPELLLLVLCLCGQIAAWGVRKSNASVQFICSVQPQGPYWRAFHLCAAHSEDDSILTEDNKEKNERASTVCIWLHCSEAVNASLQVCRRGLEVLFADISLYTA